MKNSDHFIKATAEELGKDVKLVKEVTAYFWKDVKKNLSQVNHNAIFIKNFGTIATSRRKLRNEISTIIRIVRKRPDLKEAYMPLFRKLLERRNEIAETYFKNKRSWIKPKV